MVNGTALECAWCEILFTITNQLDRLHTRQTLYLIDRGFTASIGVRFVATRESDFGRQHLAGFGFMGEPNLEWTNRDSQSSHNEGMRPPPIGVRGTTWERIDNSDYNFAVLIFGQGLNALSAMALLGDVRQNGQTTSYAAFKSLAVDTPNVT